MRLADVFAVSTPALMTLVCGGLGPHRFYEFYHKMLAIFQSHTVIKVTAFLVESRGHVQMETLSIAVLRLTLP